MQKIGVLIYEQVQPMDFIGPWEVFAMWKNILEAPIELYLISEKGGPVNCDDNLTIQSHYSFSQTPPLDYLVVPGGRGRLKEVNNSALIKFIQEQYPHLKYLLSICTGMFLVHQAKILKSADVTTYWRAIPEVQTFNDVNVVGNRVVKNKNVWFAGGISSGIDLAIELIAEIAGKEVAGQVQLIFEYFPSGLAYTDLETAKSLPPYNKNPVQPDLPAYIKNYLKEKKR